MPGTPEDPLTAEYEALVRVELESRMGEVIDESLIADISGVIARTSFAIVDVIEASQILGVSKQRVHQLYAAGKMPNLVERVNRSPLWLEVQIADFHEARQANNP